MTTVQRLLVLSSFATALLNPSAGAFSPSISPMTLGTPTYPMTSASPSTPPSCLRYHSETTSADFDETVLKPYALRDEARRSWVDKSLKYYSKVMREERRRNLGQIVEGNAEEYRQDFLHLAKKHYFALRKIKDGKPEHAEFLYRRIIDDLLNEEEGCDHARLAVTTLLLALHVQRTGDKVKTRSVFLNFFRIVVAEAQLDPHHECACSAKVLQAFALFEMKQGNEMKALDIVLKAVRMDPSLRPVLNWKQFRNSLERRKHLRKLQVQRRKQLKANAAAAAANMEL
jgi:hypothetical protein